MPFLSAFTYPTPSSLPPHHLSPLTAAFIRCSLCVRFEGTPDHKAQGSCNLVSYSSALPAAYQYVSNTAQGGSLAQADFCPYYSGYSNGDCEDAANTPTNNYYAQTFGAGGRVNVCVRVCGRVRAVPDRATAVALLVIEVAACTATHFGAPTAAPLP